MYLKQFGGSMKELEEKLDALGALEYDENYSREKFNTNIITIINEYSIY